MKKPLKSKLKPTNKAKNTNRKDYSKISPEERLDIMQRLREEHFKKHKIRPRLVKIIKIVRQK